MNKYQVTQQMRLLQEAAETDPGLAEAVVAYTRLCTDRGGEPVFCQTEAAAAHVLAHASWWQQDFLARHAALDSRAQALFVSYGQEMGRRRLPIVFCREDLAFKLGISTRQLNWLAYARDGRYRRLEVSKANGKIRVLHAPVSKLKTVQRWITDHILLKTRPHKYATAYYPGSMLSDNASPHVGRQIVVRLDLKDFFPSITHGQARRVFSSFGYTYSVSSILANLCCHEGRLVQGAPSSPALSNLVALRLDQRIAGIKRHLAWKKADDPGKLRFRYTRYADDLIFSSDEERVLKILPLVRQIIAEEGFVVNEDKLRIMRAGRQQQVTGIVVNERLNVPARQYRMLRAVLNDIRSRGVEAARERWSQTRSEPVADTRHFCQILQGRMAFIKSLNPEKGKNLLDRLRAMVSHA